MALLDNTLWGIEDKIQIAIDRLRQFEPPEGYYLAYSGGKDSDTILALAKMSGVKFDAHYNLTTVDPPEVVYHVREHPEVKIHHPEKTMWELIVQKGMPPWRTMRYCCEILKEKGGSGRFVITGVRRAESRKRRNRKLIEAYTPNGCKVSKRIINPILDWETSDVWEFIYSYNISYCMLYDEGFNRLGCILCPFATVRQRKKEEKRWPKIAEAYKRACIRAYNKKISEGKKPRTWRSGEDMYEWWISDGNNKAEADNQPSMFE